MDIHFRCIASGSNGNCAYIRTPEGVLLLDAGISTKRIFRALIEDKIDPSDIIGICISHAHGDHISGLPVLSTKLNAPVICSSGTQSLIQQFKQYDHRWYSIAKQSAILNYDDEFFLEPFSIKMMKTVHDVDGSASFQIGYKDEYFTILTDTGKLTKEHIESLKISSVALLEMNHDIPSLLSSRRPKWLKERIRASHLANVETLEPLTAKLLESDLKALLIGHLSGECNSPSIVASEIVNEEHSWPWDWYICKRDESGKKLRYDGKRVKTKMHDITQYKKQTHSTQKKITDFI